MEPFRREDLLNRLDQIGNLVRIVEAPDQPLWTRQLVDRVGVVVRNDRVGHNRVLEVLIEGTVYRMHPLDMESL